MAAVLDVGSSISRVTDASRRVRVPSTTDLPVLEWIPTALDVKSSVPRVDKPTIDFSDVKALNSLSAKSNIAESAVESMELSVEDATIAVSALKSLELRVGRLLGAERVAEPTISRADPFSTAL